MNSRATLSREEISLIVSAAKLCYYEGKTQAEAGKVLGMSRTTVSRLLTKGREHGIIEIIIHDPVSYSSDLKKALVSAFGLHDAIITPVTVDQQDIIVPQIAKAAAKYIHDNLPQQAVLGLGRGYTVYETTKALPPRTTNRLKIVPLSGGMGPEDAGFPMDGILNLAAKNLGGESKFLYAPARLYSRKFREGVLSEPAAQEICQLWDQLDWVVVGVGTIPPIRPTENPYFKRSIQAFIEETKQTPVAELVLWFILPDGSIPGTSRYECLVAAMPDQMKRAKVRMAIAGGSVKHKALYAALQSGVVNMLVTDEVTAQEMLRLKNQNG